MQITKRYVVYKDGRLREKVFETNNVTEAIKCEKGLYVFQNLPTQIYGKGKVGFVSNTIAWKQNIKKVV